MSTDPPRRPATLDEVAARAGVSRTAASRVLNNAPHVSAVKRAAVERAMRDLDYQPNRSARALARQQAGAVVLAVSLADPVVFADPFFTRIIVGLLDVLEATDRHLIICLAASPRGETRLKNLLSAQGADGILPLAVQTRDDPLLRLVQSSEMPAIFGGRPFGPEPRWYVDIDNYGGTRTALQHLIDLGRTRIATITGPVDMQVAEVRTRAYREALMLAGLTPHGIAHADFTPPGGAAAMRELLESHPDLDAVFIASDNMAMGALPVLRATGRRIPDDVAVVGYDDLRLTDPPLTTVHQPIETMGREMARMLLAVLDGADPSPVILPAKLIVRDSA